MGVMGIDQKPWSYAHNALLRELWETTPASKIAPLVGRTRNAVIGRAHRLKLAPKRFLTGNRTKSVPKRTPHARKMTNQRPTSLADKNVGAIQFREAAVSRQSGKPVAVPPMAAGNLSSSRALNGLTSADAGASEKSPFAPLAPVALPVPLLELRRASCRYIVEGEGEYALFCNADRDEGSPYCCFHHARCSYKPDKRLRAA